MARVKQAVFKFKPFSLKQKKILSWWLPESPVHDMDGIIADGAIRSGKTVSMALSFIFWAMESFQEENFAMCGKTIGSFRRNVLMVLKLMLRSRGYKFKDHRADNLLEVSRKGFTNYFYIFGGKDERSQDLIQGITLAGLFCDEVALMPESFVNQATGRCSVDGSKFWFNCNPAGPAHWFKLNWINVSTGYLSKEDIDKAISEGKELKNILYLHFTMDDNLSLSEKIKARYRSMYTGVFFKRYILGLWIAAEGIIYDLFCNSKEDFIIDKAPPIISAVIGIDFGGTGSAHSFTLTGFTPGMREVVVLDEYYHNNKEKGRLSPAELDAAFVDFAKRAKVKYKVHDVYCDSAEQTLIEGLTIAAAKARLGVEVKNAIKGPINDRIAFYNSLMAQGRFKILKHCKATISALENAVYSDKNPVKDERLDDGTTNIDSLDSMEYSTESVQDSILYLGMRG
ncbi:MAG: PBSX family phage terminase large subunit [Bacteroidaceae bacterium]|nr:PBSX family phage terminase large subunit [Bacteroidaceae bacterium]